MQDEEMDDMIRDAANQHYPAYDDKAWSKMEQQLDKHLPQKKDKRKYILFLLLLLVAGAGTYFAFNHTNNNNTANTLTATQNKNQPNTIIASQMNDAQDNLSSINPSAQSLSSTIKNSNQTIKQSSNQTNSSTLINDKPVYKKSTFIKKARLKTQTTNAEIGDDDNVENTKHQTVNDQQPTIGNDLTKLTINKNADTTKPEKTTIDLEKNTTAIKDSTTKTATTAAKSITKKDKSAFKNKFGITVSAGAGLSYVGLDYLGKTTFTYGAGISYDVSKKFLLRTGFYVASKIYTASGSEYNPPGWFAMFYPNLQNVAANCKVYEIPVSISYKFAQKKNHNWFAAAGIASYLMKREDYGYSYESTSGQPLFKSTTINNQNKHYFSILTIAGGYQYNFNNKVSFLAEPYLELPLSGIGFGKLKLNSASLLFTAIIKPFAAKK